MIMRIIIHTRYIHKIIKNDDFALKWNEKKLEIEKVCAIIEEKEEESIIYILSFYEKLWYEIFRRILSCVVVKRREFFTARD